MADVRTIEAGGRTIAVRKDLRVPMRDGLRETGSPHSPFARVAEELGYAGDPTLEPSPFFTTLHGYKELHDHG